MGQLKLAEGRTREAKSPDRPQVELVSQLAEENTNLKGQLAATWSQISEQTRKIEEERSSFWKELDQVRKKTSTLSTTAATKTASVDRPNSVSMSPVAPATTPPVQD